MSEFLFNEFDEVSAKKWKQKIQYDLKGADYNDKLIWQSPESINVKPFYHSDDFSSEFSPIPGQPQSWKIVQNIFIDDTKIVNHLALDAIQRGSEAIIFTAEREFDIKKVFKNFPFEKASIYFDFKFLTKDFYMELMQFFSTKKSITYYNVDVIGNLARTGNWYHNRKKDHEIVDTLSKNNPDNLRSVDVGLYQNAGANIVQQLAYALAHANEYLNHVAVSSSPSAALRINSIERSLLTFKLSIGSNYFFEIAKIRALRKLYAVLAREYSLNETCHIIATPSKRDKTLYDYNVNMLRTTTQCMSAILGGADAVCNLPYDTLYHKSNEFGERIARNQLLILKHESYFDTVANPADGSYYIESLTNELAEKALQLFKEIEKNGGFLKQLKDGTIQKKINESAEKEQQKYNSGELKLLGTNYHPNKKDRMKADLELFPFVKTKKGKTLLNPIVEKRLAEKTEQDRLKQES